MHKVSGVKEPFHIIKNIYETNPLNILIVNPFTSSVMRKVLIPPTPYKKVRGGAVDHRSKDIQLGDLSVFDKNVQDFKVEEVVISSDGNPNSVMIYPQDNVVTLRDKIYVATGIPPFRQHLLLENSKKNMTLTYTISAANNFLDINLFNDLQKTKSNTILNIPIDTDTYNRKTDLEIVMNDMKETMMSEDGSYITTVIICDLYTILSPNNENIEAIIQSEQQRELIYYGFIIKYYPILPYEGFVQVYEKKSEITYLYPYLKQPFNKLRNRYEKEKELLNLVYKEMPKSLTYVKSITKRDIYFITSIVANVKLPVINIRNLFDNFELTKYYIYSALKMKIGSNTFWIDKRYILANDIPEISCNRINVDNMYIMTDDGVKIYITKDSIVIESKYNENDNMTFESVKINLNDLIKPLINYMNKLGVLIITEGDSIDMKSLNVQITNSTVEASWPENCTSEQFSCFRQTLQKYEEADVLIVKTAAMGQYDVNMITGVSCCSQNKLRSIMSQISETWNQFDYYSNPAARTKWNDMSRNSINFIQKASSVTMIMNGFANKEFNLTLPLLMGMLYIFSSRVCRKMIVKDTEKVSKRLKKLKGIDPDLYSLRRYDPDIAVYSVRCQSDRQPVIYKQQEVRTLSQTIKNRLVKFWNFTEQKPVYYDCPNRNYPNLSFGPHNHPLGYCLPCCKKLVSSVDSRQAKVDKICQEKFIIPPDQLEEMIKKMDKEYTHILSYGKCVGLDRTSYISPLFENNVLISKSKYRLLGVKQDLPLFNDAGFLYSIVYVLGLTLDKYGKDLVKIINKDTFGVLDEGHTMRLHSPEELREAIMDIMIDTTRTTICADLSTIDWINVFSELTYLVYGVHIILLMDYDDELKLRMLNTAQVALLHTCDENKFMVLAAHDNGIYPLVETPNRLLFNCKNDAILTSIKDVVSSEIDKVEYVGITLNNIINFTKFNKDFKIKSLLKGKRGMIYAAILSDNVYVPCIYTEYEGREYKMETGYPDMNKFKRADLYDFITDYNNFIIKKYKSKSNYNLMLIDPVGILEHNKKYVGIRIRFVYDRYGMTFHHAPESSIGRYHVKVINIPYDLNSVNAAISKQSSHTIGKDVENYAYQNYIYSLFLAEFAYEIRKYKNASIRNLLEAVLRKSNTNIDKREIRHILDKYPSDYKSVIEMVSHNTPKKSIGLIQNTIFDFDLVGLKKLRDLPEDKRSDEIEKMMEKHVVFIPKGKHPGISNTLVSCMVNTGAPQCEKGKLLMVKSDFNDCCGYLAKDLEIPYLFETIHFKIMDTRNCLKFIRRKTEVLHIKELD